MMLTQQQQLQLPPRVLLVPPQLLLDLLVDPLVLFVLRRHAAASHPSHQRALCGQGENAGGFWRCVLPSLASQIQQKGAEHLLNPFLPLNLNAMA